MNRIIVAVGIITAAIMLLSGCSDKTVNPSNDYGQGKGNDYVPGEVIVIWQDTVKYEFARSFFEQKSVFIVHFDGSTSTDSAAKLINSVKGLSVKSIDVFFRYTLVKVPSGQEKLWVDALKHYPFIKTAEVNAITHTT